MESLSLFGSVELIDSAATGYIPELNRRILDQVKGIDYRVSAIAPGTEIDLFSHIGSELVIWDGGSDQTIYGSESVNHAFRCWHDSIHLRYGLGFSIPEEIEVARIQARMIGGDRLGDIIFAEIGGQAEYLMRHGEFPIDQRGFISEYLGEMWGESVVI